MAVALRGSITSNTAAGATNMAVNKPAGVVAGDVLVIWSCRSDSHCTASGFTNVTGTNLEYNEDLLWRVADGSEGSTFTITGSATSTYALALCAAFSGAAGGASVWDPSTPVGAASARAANHTPSFAGLENSSSKATVNDGDMLLWLVQVLGPNPNILPAITAPAGFTLQTVSQFNLTFYYAEAGIAYQVQATHGTTGTLAGSIGGSVTSPEWSGNVVAIRAASTPVTGTASLALGPLSVTATGTVTVVAKSPDPIAYCCTNSSALKVLDAATGVVQATLTMGSGSTQIAKVSPDGTQVAVTFDFTGVQFVATSGNVVGSLFTTGLSSAYGLAWAPDSSKVYIAGTGAVQSCTPAGVLGPVWTVSGMTSFTELAISPDGTKLYCGCGLPGTPAVKQVDTTSGAVTATYTGFANVYGICVSPDGTKVYVSDAETPQGHIYPITVTTGTVGTAVTAGTYPYGLCISPDGSTLWVAEYAPSQVQVIDTSSMTVTHTLTSGWTNAFEVAMTPDGSTVWVGDYTSVTVVPVSTSTFAVGTATALGSGNGYGIGMSPATSPVRLALGPLTLTAIGHAPATGTVSFSLGPLTTSAHSVLLSGIASFALGPLTTAATGSGPAPTLTFVSASAGSSYTAHESLIITSPADLERGNLLVAVVGMNNTTPVVTPAVSGWTAVDHYVSGTGCSVYIWTRPVGPREPPAYSFTGGSWLAGTILQYADAAIGSVAWLDFGSTPFTIPAPATTAGPSDIRLEVVYTEDGVLMTGGTPIGMTPRSSAIQDGLDGIAAFDRQSFTGDTSIMIGDLASSDNGIVATILLSPSGVPAGPPAALPGQVLYATGDATAILEKYDPTAGTWSAVATPWDNAVGATGAINGGDAGVYVAEWGLFFLGGVAYTISGYPTLLSSSDGVTWTETANPLAGGNYSIVNALVWNGTRLLAAGEGPTTTSPSIATTDDGVTWTGHTSVFDGFGYIWDAAWNGSYWLAVGTDSSGNGAAAISPDGITWTTIAMPWNTGSVFPKTVEWFPSASLWAVGGQDSPVGTPGTILTSPGPPWTWTAQTVPLNLVNRIRNLNGQLFATGGFSTYGYNVAISTDAVTWTLSGFIYGTGNTLFWDGSLYWQGGSATYSSPDGLTWTQSPGLLDTAQNFAFFQGVPTVAPLPPAVPAYDSNPGPVPILDPAHIPAPTHAGALFAFGNSDNSLGPVTISRFSDGFWLAMTTPWDGQNPAPYAGLWVGAPINKFFVGGFVGTGPAYPVLMSSSDGITWANVTTPWDGNVISAIYAMGWNGSILVAAGAGVSSSDNSIMTSTDGVTWTGRSSVMGPGGGWVNDVAWNGSYWLAVGIDASDHGTAATSPDGITWTTHPTPWNTSSLYPTSVTWHAPSSRWVVVGSVSGQALVSTDGLTWTSESLNLSPGSSVRSYNGEVLAVGGFITTAECVAVSPDGISWSMDTLTSPLQGLGVYWDGGTYWVGTESSPTTNVWASSDAISWFNQTGPFSTGTVNGFFSHGSVTPPTPPPAITFVSATSQANTSSAGSITISAPSGIVAGNLLLALVGSNTGFTMTPPTGWTVQAFYTHGGDLQVLTKVASGSEPSSYTFTGGSWLAGAILQYSGTTTLDGTVSYAAIPSGTSATASSVTPTVPGDQWITAFYSYDGVTFTTPSGMTARAAAQVATDEGIAVFDQALASTAATGTASSTMSGTDTGLCVSFLLHA